eukprot:3992993-Pyramimonas_sp.AAC.1
MEAYWRSRGAAAEVDPETPEDPEPEPQARGRGGEVGSPYGVGDGWEEYADASFWWQGHNLLEADVLCRTAHVSSVVFCCRCGT